MYKIAIDGPGGAGKSSVAKAIAKKLKIVYVDTGALYRTIGYYMCRNGIDTTSHEDVTAHLSDFTLEMKFQNGRQIITLNGTEIGDEIRTPEISMAASNVSAIPSVRKYLLNTQRDIAKRNCVIMDGRDIGTVIFPEADVKIFLTASPEARARRRYEELLAKGSDVNYEDVLRDMKERDNNDSTRAIAPCVPAEDAIIFDNSELSAEETADQITSIVTNKLPFITDLPRPDSVYMKWHKVLAGFFRFIFGIKIHGLENVPQNGGIIFCANHTAARDAIVIAASCQREIKFVAKKELFSVPLLGRLIKMLGAVKLDRGGNDVGAVRTSVNLIKAGYALSIFPQGHRHPGVNPTGTPIKNGAAMICYHAMCDVVPVCIKVKGFKYGLFKRVDVIFGEPLRYDALGFDSNEAAPEKYRTATRIIFDSVLSLGGFNTSVENEASDSEN